MPSKPLACRSTWNWPARPSTRSTGATSMPILACMDDDVQAVSRLGPLEGDFHGHDGIRRLWETLFEVWPDLTTEVVEMRDVET